MSPPLGSHANWGPVGPAPLAQPGPVVPAPEGDCPSRGVLPGHPDLLRGVVPLPFLGEHGVVHGSPTSKWMEHEGIPNPSVDNGHTTAQPDGLGHGAVAPIRQVHPPMSKFPCHDHGLCHPWMIPCLVVTMTPHCFGWVLQRLSPTRTNCCLGAWHPCPGVANWADPLSGIPWLCRRSLCHVRCCPSPCHPVVTVAGMGGWVSVVG